MTRSLVVMLAAVSLVACGGAAEEAGRPANMPDPTPPGNAPMVMMEEQAQPMQSQVEQPTAPPRLSHVVTLGQTEDYAPMPQPGANGQGNGTSITINNNVNVGSGYGGYGYGGYGYGGYGGAGYGRGYYHGGSGYAANPYAGPSHAAGGPNSWGASGWEGAGRTAAYGHTPNVGGNYSAPQSAGPRAMR